MTRQEAIDSFRSAWLLRDYEFLSKESDYVDSYKEMQEAFRTLGVTDEELKI